MNSGAVFLPVALALVLAACQPAPAAPTAAPAKPTAPAGSPAAKPAESPAAKPAASPVSVPAQPAAGSAQAKPPERAVNVDEATRYFGGKTITITVGFSPGGGYDTFARILAEFMPNYIPGSPKIAVTNLPGGASLLAWQTVMRKTPGNGLDIALFSGGLLTQAILGEKLESFDLDTPIYLGAPDFAPRKGAICVRTELAGSFDAFLKSPRKLKIGEAVQATGPGAMKMWLSLVGLPVQPVYGYGGTSELNTAFDRAELDLTDRCDEPYLSNFPHWIGQNVATPLFFYEQSPEWIKAPMAQGKWPWFGYVADIAKVTPDQRAALEVNNRLSAGERLFALPPRTPDNTVNALRQALADTVHDPAFQAEMTKRNFDYGLKTPEMLQEVLNEARTLKPEVLSLLQAMYRSAQ